MTTDADAARDRIARADLMTLGFSYLDFARLPFLSWPLQAASMSDAEWFAWIVRTVAGAPVCGRTTAQVLDEFGRIDHQGLRRILPKVRELVGGVAGR